MHKMNGYEFDKKLKITVDASEFDLGTATFDIGYPKDHEDGISDCKFSKETHSMAPDSDYFHGMTQLSRMIAVYFANIRVVVDKENEDKKPKIIV